MNQPSEIRPPVWAMNLFRKICRSELAEDIEGDLIERFNRNIKSGHASMARKQFIKEVLLLIRPNLVKPLFKRNSNKKDNPHGGSFLTYNAMLQNIFKTTLRSLLKQRAYTIINTLGLAIGLASCFLILLWVNDEYKIDKFHENSDRIYQLKRLIIQNDGQNFTTIAVPQPVKAVLEKEYPEVDMVTLIGWDVEALFRNEKEEAFKETGKFMSPEFLKIFSFPLELGDPNTALNDLNSIVISEELAMKLYGSDWRTKAIGKTIPLGNDQLFTVTGVLRKLPVHSTLHFQWIIPAQSYISQNDWVENWNNGGFRMVVLMKDGADMDAFGKKVINEVNKHIEGDERIVFQKYEEQYLYSNFENGVEQGGRIDFVRVLFIVAICILIIASINFMNLATARSATRAKEIGMRKVMGANRPVLTFQFLSEALMISIFATILAVLIVQLLLPAFNMMTAKFIFIDFSSASIWVILIATALITGVLSGIYPAFFLSSFKPLSIIRGHILKIGGSALMRKVLVVFQFTISIILIIGTTVILKQIGFIMNKNLGFNRENVVMVPLEGSTGSNFESYRIELLRIPGITTVTAANQNPISVGRSTGGVRWDGKDPDFQIEINVLLTHHSFIETMKLELIRGNDFSGNYAIDSTGFIINEVVADLMDKDDPVGENISVYGVDGKVIGVVKNYHMTSLHNPIEPTIIMNFPQHRFAFIRIKGSPSDVLPEIKEVNETFNPGFPFEYSFMDDDYAANYQSELMVADLAKSFTGVAIFISCLGLFGLSSFMVQQRVREIGIRKVLGASVNNLFMLLSLNFSKLILIAIALAIPAGYFFANNWLEQFTYRTSLGVSVFIISGIGALIIAIITVSFKAVTAAMANPVENLKEE